ncbi:MAG TPA: peptidylprolyl isomerase, partial [Hyphomicrobium sp.]|nr:peptidylprolyl isomerase [Hyphomicrobium sp.]
PECDDEGRSETPEEAMIRELIASSIVTPEPTDADCRRYFDRNRDKFRSPTIYEAAHILLSGSQHDDASFEARRRDAEALIATLSREPERFAAIAQAHSACPSSTEGGRLGQIVAGQTTPEFEKALTRLAPGEMTQTPVETRYGFHIIRLDRRIAGEEVPFDLAKGRIAEYLRAAAINQARALYVQMLVGNARIDGVQLDAGQHRSKEGARLS